MAHKVVPRYYTRQLIHSAVAGTKCFANSYPAASSTIYKLSRPAMTIHGVHGIPYGIYQSCV